MSKFKKIVVRPLTDFDALGIKINETKQFDLGVLSKEQVSTLFQIISKEVEKGGGIMVTPMEEGRFVTANFKASEGKKYIHIPEPNPICVYYKSANEHLEKSLPFRDAVLKCPAPNQQQYEDFVEYFQEASEGVTLLCKTIEGYVNQQIPDHTALEVNGKKGKKNLEWLPIGEKLRDLMIALKGIDFHKTNSMEHSKITEMIKLRDDLVHLKTTIKPNFTVYQQLFKRLIDFKHVECSNAVFTFVNTMAPGYFVEQEKELPPAEKVG